jgi:hypothetical protein
MSNKFFLWFLLVLLIVSVGFCLRFLYVKYTEWQDLASILSTLSRLKAENGNLTTIAQVCGGLFLLLGLFFTGWNSWIAQSNMKIAEDGKITDRFSKAVEQLGNDKLAIRLGGIYALERIAKDSEKDHQQVMEVLTAFVRDNSHPFAPQEKLDTDIQSALTVIGRRDSVPIKRGTLEIDLRKAYLSKAFLPNANFKRACLECVNFEESYLLEVNFKDAWLRGVNFRYASLKGVNFKEAVLDEANLTGANLEEAKNLTIDQLSTVETLYDVKGLDSTLRKQVQEKHPHLLKKPQS